MVQLSRDSEPAILFMDPHTVEPADVVVLEASVGTTYGPSVHGCDDKSGFLVGEPIVPDSREIIMAAPNLPGNLQNRSLVPS